jgi:2'-5' RNA ligase
VQVLGEVDEREVGQVCRIASDVAEKHAPFEAAIESIGCFPNARRPRVIWAGISRGAEIVAGIHAELEIPFADLGYRREERRYTPHITLGRVAGDGPHDGLARALREHEEWLGGDFAVREIHIMSSELTSKGSVYTVMGRAPLKGSR